MEPLTFRLPNGQRVTIKHEPLNLPFSAFSPFDEPLAAYVENKPVGSVTCQKISYENTLRLSRFYVVNLHVQPAFRGQGIVDSLFAGIFALANAMGIPQVYLHIREDAPGLARLYTRLGAFTKPQLPKTFMWDAPFPAPTLPLETQAAP